MSFWDFAEKHYFDIGFTVMFAVLFLVPAIANRLERRQ